MSSPYSETLQDKIPACHGSPEGTIDGPRGLLMVDKVSGVLYQKRSDPGTKTGWVNITTPSGLTFTADNDVQVTLAVVYDAETESYTLEITPA